MRLVNGVMAMVVYGGFVWSLSVYYGIFSVLGIAYVVSIDVPGRYKVVWCAELVGELLVARA
jgi:hypothetical protein